MKCVEQYAVELHLLKSFAGLLLERLLYMNQDQRNHLHQLDYRLHKVEKELLHAELLYQLALVCDRQQVLHEIKLDVDNLRRKLNWFTGAIKKYMHSLAGSGS